MQNFETEINVRWSDVDQNRHVRHSAYYDYGAHCRIRYFKEIGLDSKMMADAQLGPIIFKETCSFLKELHLEDTLSINLLKGEVSPDGAKWVLHHEIFNTQGDKCAHLTLQGAWMDLSLRKLTVPPMHVAKAFHDLPLGDYYTYKKKK